MNRRIVALLVIVSASVSFVFAQGESSGTAARAVLLKQVNMRKFGVPSANYSGIARIEGDSYVVVSDKERLNGFFPFTIQQDSVTGKVLSISRGEMRGSEPETRDRQGLTTRDEEGVAYVPSASAVFVSGEGDQRILEFTLSGELTGREAAVPSSMSTSAIYGNSGFEALAYSAKDDALWTVTEQTLRADGKLSDWRNPVPCKLRLQSFSMNDLQPKSQFIYETDAPTKTRRARSHAFGVPALCALPDGSLLVLEREFYVRKYIVGSFVRCKVYRVNPHAELPTSQPMSKQLVADFTTRLNFTRKSFANFEGMCLGPTLADGRQSVLLISDSQNRYGNAFGHINDYLKIMLLDLE